MTEPPAAAPPAGRALRARGETDPDPGGSATLLATRALQASDGGRADRDAAAPGGVGRRRWEAVHPVAWWVWALGLAAAASRTTNPLVLGLLMAAICLVVTLRRTDPAAERMFRLYLVLALAIVAIRLVWRVVFAGGGSTVLFRLPRLALPGSGGEVSLGGPVSAEALSGAMYGGLQLGAIILCVGAANCLADPRRLLATMPGALEELGAVLTVAVAVFPQLARSVDQVRRAKALRPDPPPPARAGRGWRARRRAGELAQTAPGPHGWPALGDQDQLHSPAQRPSPTGRMRRRVGGLRRVLLPVLVDSLDRSVELAAAMDSRGYGRRGVAPVAVRRLTTCVLVGAVLALSLAAYGLFDSSGLPAGATWALLGTGGLGTGLGLWLAGRHTVRTRYRPERWTAAAWGVAGCGAVCTAAFAWYSAVQPALMHPAPPPGEWPSTTPLLVAATVAAAAAALISPTPVTASDAA